MGGGLSLHCCPMHALKEQTAKMIAELPPEYLPDVTVSYEVLDVAETAWHQIIHDKELLSRFFDTFFRISAELGDSSIQEAHGSGLKTRSKFIVETFGDALKMLRSTDQAEIDATVENNCRHYLLDLGLRVPQYIIIGQVMMRSFEECENPYWTEDHRVAWQKLLSVIVKLLIRHGLRVEATLSPEELANLQKKLEQIPPDTGRLSDTHSTGEDKDSVKTDTVSQEDNVTTEQVAAE